VGVETGGELAYAPEEYEGLIYLLVSTLRRGAWKCLLFPSLTVRSPGLRGSLKFGGGVFRRGADSVKQTSGRTFGPRLTVARHLEGPFARYFEVFRGRQLSVTVGVFGTLCEAKRRRLQGVDISLDC
jgi:hypothetical protein